MSLRTRQPGFTVIATAPSRLGARRQRGVLLVELLVGLAVGLLIVAGATTVVASHLVDTRRLVVEAQVQQDLRASADLVTRSLRRAAYWNSAATTVWAPGAGVAANPNDAVTLTPDTEVGIRWSDANVLGLRLAAGSPGVLQMKDGGGSWQALTDAATLNITGLTLRMATVSPSASSVPAMPPMACAALCADGTTSCWPTLQVREIQLGITARSVADPDVVRSIVSSVRLRNDQVCNNRATPCDPAPTLPLCPG